jgi:hypothetical protein
MTMPQAQFLFILKRLEMSLSNNKSHSMRQPKPADCCAGNPQAILNARMCLSSKALCYLLITTQLLQAFCNLSKTQKSFQTLCNQYFFGKIGK